MFSLPLKHSAYTVQRTSISSSPAYHAQHCSRHWMRLLKLASEVRTAIDLANGCAGLQTLSYCRRQTVPACMQAGLVVAEVISVKAHPKADRLRVCSVDCGHDVAQVVTNAANVTEGMKVIFAVCQPAGLQCIACGCGDCCQQNIFHDPWYPLSHSSLAT